MKKDFYVVINMVNGVDTYEILGRNLLDYIDDALEALNPKEVFIVQSVDLLQGIVEEHGRDSLYIVMPGNALISTGDVAAALSMAESKSSNVINIKEVPGFDSGMVVNNYVDLARVSKIVQRQINEKHMKAGVIMMDPEQSYIGAEVKIGAGTVIYPGTIITGDVTIGAACVIGPNSRLTDMRIGSRVKFEYSVGSQSSIGDGTTVGPFAYLRPGSIIGKNVKIGDFVEVKNAVMGDGSKASHLSYIGDADVGADVNIGCGTVIVNYDGMKKHRTTVEDGAFIGCNTNLVAPVKVGRGAYTAAGSTITTNVPAEALGIARERQVNKEGWTTRRKGK